MSFPGKRVAVTAFSDTVVSVAMADHI